MAVTGVTLCVCCVIVILSSRALGVLVKPVNNPTGLTFFKGDLHGRNGRKCQDFCIPSWCLNGGTCVTKETTCIGSCVCTKLWTGNRCGERLSTDFISSILNAISNSSRTNLLREYRHGIVGKNLGNKGELFNQFQDILHELESLNTVKDISAVADHAQSEMHTFNTESITISPENSLTVPLPSLNGSFKSQEICIQFCANGDCVKINGTQYRCENQSTRVCSPGFECIHGICDLEGMKNNSFRCICEGNYKGQFCNHKCPLVCGNHGYCDIDVSGNSSKCFCAWNYTGYNCSELIPQETEMIHLTKRILFHWYILGSSIAVVIVLLIGTLLAIYFLWKKRLVFVLKIVHFFQEYEDDDGKEFDAFVSYKSTEKDEKFVLTELFPRLEGTSKFKLCLHFRDFEPGQAIANNILKAIENSRRTIMILSPSYVTSEWCRMEYQKAQHEMLKLKHKIIPIMLEDISQVKDLDMNLKSILDSVTYLAWPGLDSGAKKVEKFWTKLDLALPKKSSLSHSSVSSQSMMSTQPLSDSIISSSSITSSTTINSSLNKSTLTLSIPADISPGCPASSETIPNSSKLYQRRRKNLGQFINRFVCSNLKFNRQDSNSSHFALVDEETAGSRSSCDSVSESNLTESTESMCSMPVTPNGYMDEAAYEIYKTSSYFNSHACKEIITELEEKRSIVCEKDHCDGMECRTCLNITPTADYDKDRHNSCDFNMEQEFVGGERKSSEHCKLCQIEQESSDNNRVKISVIEGSDQVRIQRLTCVDRHRKCNHQITPNRMTYYRGSLNNRKESVNKDLSILNRSGTLPRNFQSKILATSISDLGDSIYSEKSYRATSFQLGTEKMSQYDQSNCDKNVTSIIDSNLNASPFIPTGDASCYMDVCESI